MTYDKNFSRDMVAIGLGLIILISIWGLAFDFANPYYIPNPKGKCIDTYFNTTFAENLTEKECMTYVYYEHANWIQNKGSICGGEKK